MKYYAQVEMNSVQLIRDEQARIPGLGSAIPILMYHQIDWLPEKSTPYRYLTVDPGNFSRQMKWLKRLGYQGISVRELMAYLSGERTGRVVGITFDDGFRNVYQHALPVLQAVGFTATCYFVSGQVGGYNAWDEKVGIPRSACMSKAEIREWASLGHEVGAHTVDHVHLTRVNALVARRQVNESRDRLEDLLGRGIASFSYPYGDVSQKVRDAVAEAGFSHAVTTKRGRARPSDDRLLIPRRTIRDVHGWVALLRKCVTG